MPQMSQSVHLYSCWSCRITGLENILDKTEEYRATETIVSINKILKNFPLGNKMVFFPLEYDNEA